MLLCLPTKEYGGVIGKWRGTVMVGGHRMVNVWFNAEQAGEIADQIEGRGSDGRDD